MRMHTHLSILACLAVALPSPLLAQAEQANETVATTQQSPLRMRAEEVVEIVNGYAVVEEVFTASFLAAVPPAQLAAASRQFVAQYGKALSVESVEPSTGSNAAIVIRMERALARGQISLDPANNNRINGLTFSTFEPINVSVDQIESDLADLPGDVSVWFGRLDGSDAPIIASEWGDQMPIGSTFKLYVLATLGREVAQGRRDWGDTVVLPDTRSFPSGMMQDWPQQSVVTLDTLASMMISISDNTATDVLIDVLGRDAVLQTLIDSGHSQPQLNDPFLKTREMFLLKSGPEGRMTAYQNGDSDLRVQILEGIEEPAIPFNAVSAAFSRGPNALDIEWFASANDLAALLRFIRRTSDPAVLDMMAINSNMSNEVEQNWLYAGYKGGSEPGVLNLTWLLMDDYDTDYALILSWRDDEASLDENALELIAQRILSLPR